MTYVASFTGIKPNRRYDAQPYLTIKIWETEFAGGEFPADYDVIETVTISPVDSNPANPVARSLTTALAVYPSGNYILEFTEDVLDGSWISSPLTSNAVQAESLEGWFDYDILLSERPRYAMLAAFSEAEANTHQIPDAIRYVKNAVGNVWTTAQHTDLVAVAKNIALRMILASDEVVEIAKARGQNSITVAGETLTFNTGKNPYLLPEDELVLAEIRGEDLSEVHTDKIVVRTDGLLYTQEAPDDYADYTVPDYLNG